MSSDESYRESYRARVKSALIFLPETIPGDIRELWESTIRRIRSAIPHIQFYSNRVIPEATGNHSPDGDFRILTVNTEPGNPIQCLKDAFTLSNSMEDDGILYFHGLAPFFDEDLFDEMADLHFKYMASCTIAENLPAGFLPDFFSPEFVDDPPECGGKSLRECVMSKINDLDVEIFFRLPDLRQMRLNLDCMDHRSAETAKNILKKQPGLNYENLQEFIQNNPLILRGSPSCIELEVTSDSPVYPGWFLRRTRSESPHMEMSVFDDLIRDLEISALPGDVSVILGGQGDPLKHPEIAEMIRKLLSNTFVRAVYLETFGTDLNDSILRELSGLAGIEKLSVIIRLSTLNKDRYRVLYGTDRLADVMENIALIENQKSDLPFSVYVELLRISDVEDEIDEFFKRFDESKIVPLAQKFNSYAGKLNERRVSDLTPLNREFCWHLARDVFIMHDGSIPICKQDPLGEKEVISQIQNGGIMEYRKKTDDYFISSFKGKHDEIPAPCPECDEWYTFNA